MKKFFSVSLAVLLLSIPFSVYSPIFATDDEGVYFYSDGGFSGRWNEFHEEINVPDFSLFYVGNDAISSIKIVGLYEVTVYQDSNYRGTSHTYRFSNTEVYDEVIGNDRISSAKIRKISQTEKNGVYIYKHRDFNGKWIKLTSSMYDLDRTILGSDQASSVRVVGNYKYTLHKDIYYSGRYTTSTTLFHTLVGTYVGNDEVSSVTIKKY